MVKHLNANHYVPCIYGLKCFEVCIIHFKHLTYYKSFASTISESKSLKLKCLTTKQSACIFGRLYKRHDLVSTLNMWPPYWLCKLMVMMVWWWWWCDGVMMMVMWWCDGNDGNDGIDGQSSLDR